MCEIYLFRSSISAVEVKSYVHHLRSKVSIVLCFPRRLIGMNDRAAISDKQVKMGLRSCPSLYIFIVVIHEQESTIMERMEDCYLELRG